MTKPTQGSVTIPLKVNNTGFLLDRMGMDCAPLQFLRELTQNAIEAVRRTPEQKGEIVWDVDWTQLEMGETSNFKLCITDNGDGMTGPQMEQFINELSSSGTVQTMVGNYGVGAKIAAGTRNHAGMVYLSWKDGRGWMIHFWRDPTTGVYGLKQIERPDGTFGGFSEVEDAIKPEMIKDHGTKIVLLGMEPDANTVEAPTGAASPSKWIAKYLNGRYFDIPDGVEIRAREGWDRPRSDKDNNLLRKLTGQDEYLKQHEKASGTVQLTGAAARWWILRDEPAISNNSGYIESAGHVAALYKGELYEMMTGRGGRARLQSFGVLYGTSQVVIYVEPTPDAGGALTTNTARTNLLMNGMALPWADWEAEFRDNMPKPILDLMEEIAAKTAPSDNSKSIRDRLKALMDLYKVSRYRVTPTGKLTVDDQQPIRGGQPQSSESSSSSSSDSGRSGSKGGTAGGVYALFQKKDGALGTEVKPDPFPETKWVSVADRTREQGDIEDRAARFLQDQNQLLINRDFRVFKDMVDRFLKMYPSNTRATVASAVENWFEQALVEAVMGVQAIRGSKEWTNVNIDKALSEEALTLAVMQRYHVFNSVKRELGSKLGKVNAG